MSAILTALLGAVAYSVLTENWASFIGVGFLLAIGIYIYALLLGLKFKARSWVVGLVLAYCSATAINWYFDSQTHPTETFTIDVRYGAVARDGWISSATGQGACSHHGGVDHWLTRPESRTQTFTDAQRWSRAFGRLWFLLPVVCGFLPLVAERIVYGKMPGQIS